MRTTGIVRQHDAAPWMELVGMNRSLEALAILVMCLVGILAAVRISTRDQASASRPTEREPAAPSEKVAPAKSSSSAVETATEPNRECLAWQVLDYEGSCGLDRSTGQVYRPLSPLLSPGEFAARVIRSQPLPLIVLPEAEPKAELTEYDAAYDAAMFGELAQATLDYQQIEAEYAAAEQAAAFDATDEGIFFPASRNSLTRGVLSLAPWMSEQLQGTAQGLTDNVQHYQRAYAPVIGAARGRWTEHVAPRLRLFPRSPAAARKNLLLREQAREQQIPRVTWHDYEQFADREIGYRPAVAVVPPLVPIERASRLERDDDIWRSR
jgi:hypothetical protein